MLKSIYFSIWQRFTRKGIKARILMITHNFILGNQTKLEIFKFLFQSTLLLKTGFILFNNILIRLRTEAGTCDDMFFLDFLKKLLEIDPTKRLVF